MGSDKSSIEILLSIYNSPNSIIISSELQNILKINTNNQSEMENYVHNLQTLLQDGLIYCPNENCGYKELTTGYYKTYSTFDAPLRLTDLGYHTLKTIQA